MKQVVLTQDELTEICRSGPPRQAVNGPEASGWAKLRTARDSDAYLGPTPQEELDRLEFDIAGIEEMEDEGEATILDVHESLAGIRRERRDLEEKANELREKINAG